MAFTCRVIFGQTFVHCFRRTKVVSVISARYPHKFTQADVKPTKYKAVYQDLHGTLEDESSAKDFVYALDKHERSLLQVELTKFSQGPDSEGSESAQKPTNAQLKKVCLHNCLPFIGFGFLDNFLMIIAGEYIELTFGQMLGISTMAAAAMGNLISDLAGLQSAHYVEVMCSKFGVRAPALTPQQVDMSFTRWTVFAGKAIGIIIGCTLGMFPLLFYEDPTKETDTSEDSSKATKDSSP